jgi:hypothetical protein
MNQLRVPNSTEIYGNWTVVGPDNQFMFHCGTRKAKWYLKKNLAIVLYDQTIQLSFTPKGGGHKESAEYFKESRINQCVVCSATENLTKHHIVPSCYRKHFPEKYKSHNCFDIVAICCACHDAYERKAFGMHKELAKHIPISQEFREVNYIIDKVNKSLYALREHRNGIPEARRKSLLGFLERYFERSILLEQIEEISYIDKEFVENKIGLQVVQKIQDLPEFILMWREHFLRVAQPKFLSPRWLEIYKTIF